MHADLTDASVHVPAEVLTPPRSRETPAASAPDAHRPSPVAVRQVTPTARDAFEGSLDSGPSPTYDEIADRALELCQRRGGINGRDLQDWIDAERQLRTERLWRYAVLT